MTLREELQTIYLALKKRVRECEEKESPRFLCNILDYDFPIELDGPVLEIVKSDIFNEFFNPSNRKWSFLSQNVLEKIYEAAMGEGISPPVWSSQDSQSRLEFIDRMIEKYSSEEIVVD